MPAYNHVRYIGAAIESVLGQTYPHFELIIIDNFSDDGTGEIAQGHASRDSRIRYLQFRNGGIIANSRNAGLDAACGELIAFIDSDDVWREDKLEKQTPLFCRESVGLVYSNCSVIDQSGKILLKRRFRGLVRGNVVKPLLLTTLGIVNSTVVVRKGLLDRRGLRFRQGRQGAEDWDLWICLSGVSEADYINESLVLYRTHDKSESKNRELMLKSASVVIDDYEYHVSNDSFLNMNERKAMLTICRVGRIAAQHSYVSVKWARGYILRGTMLALKAISIMPLNAVGWHLLARTYVYYCYRTMKAAAVKMSIADSVDMPLQSLQK